ncbi:hypothetical protein ANCCAN_22563 [Ancylostoma caninum]|uniref:Uncharacterized protein n=1 Tax=Ancylostoma caninum TaxID=29170 RepID=A0A368FHD8_ANCCA|nr:hypothetical protein ANCCAN_22563 [Ancylostoma caninum]
MSRLQVKFYMEKYVLCYPDFAKFVPKKDQGLVWLMRSLRFCEVNQIFAYSRYAHTYHRDFQTLFLKYAYALICDKGRLVPKEEHFNMYLYSSLFKALYERDNTDRMLICQRISDVYSDLYSRCYVPHVGKRQKKISERCSGQSTPLLKFPSLFQRFSRYCDDFNQFINNSVVSSPVCRDTKISATSRFPINKLLLTLSLISHELQKSSFCEPAG